MKTYKNLMEALKHLQNEGYSIKKTKIYQDKKAGLITMGEDGKSVSEDALTAYIVKGGLKKKIVDSDALEENAAKKALAERRLLEIREKKIQLEIDITQGKYILLSQHEQALAERAAVLKSDMERFPRTYAADIIAVAGGKPERANDLIDFFVEHLGRWMHRYSEKRDWEIPKGVER